MGGLAQSAMGSIERFRGGDQPFSNEAMKAIVAKERARGTDFDLVEFTWPHARFYKGNTLAETWDASMNCYVEELGPGIHTIVSNRG